MNPFRVERVVCDGVPSVLVSVNAAHTMVSLTATELTVTLSPKVADALAMDLADAAETRDGAR